ncbi:MAG: hypothetical protein P9L99_12280 [Candidatus Lernaella stagnicola]|nr:hypothetical protein [Candidatus Lernaella stagnicola]
MGRINDIKNMVDERRLGFTMDEVMTGTHEFEPGFGEPGEKFMEFRVTWGPKHVSEFINPIGGKFMYNDLRGTVTIEGLCEDAPCDGSLELLYFTEGKIRYTFTFEIGGTEYLFIGEKVNLRPWNVHKTHTTCYGTLSERDTGRLVSKSITYFRFSTTPAFVASFRLA